MPPPYINLGGDFGTRNASIVAEEVFDGGASSNTKPTEIELIKLEICENLRPEFVQRLLYVPSGNVDNSQRLVLARKVSEELRQRGPLGQHFQNNVMEFFKLALHPNFDNMKAVAHVKKILSVQDDRGRLQELYTDYFEEVISAVRSYYKKRSPRADRETYYDNIQIVAQLCVPAIWGDDPRGIIRNAAKIAGFAKAELREEPLCSAAVSMHELLRWKAIKEGQCSLHFDCGSGTHDASVTRLDTAPSDGQQMGLTRIAICTGNAAGSQMLNHQLLLYLSSDNCEEIRRHGGIERLCSMMGIQLREFERQASDKFDRVKEEFPGETSPLTISGASGADSDINDIVIHLPHELIQQWYNVWIAKTVQLIRNHINRVIKWAAEHPDGPIDLDIACAVFSGGGYQSSLLVEESRKVVNELLPECWVYRTDDPITCAKGALFHHYFQEDTLLARMHFYLARTEAYRSDLHPDAEPVGVAWDSKAHVVPDRLTCILNREDGRFSGQVLLPMTFYVDIPDVNGSRRQPRLHVDLYWSENHLEDHSALRDRDGKLIKGIRSFPLVWTDIDESDLQTDGFSLVTRKGGVPHYVVNAWVEMSHSDEKLTITVYLMNHSYKLP